MIELDDCFAIEKAFKFMNSMVLPYYNYDKLGFKPPMQLNLRRNYYHVEQAAKISKQKESKKYQV